MTHGDDEGTLGEVGDGPEPANLTKMAGGSEVEDDGDGGDAGLPEGCGTVGRKRGSRGNDGKLTGMQQGGSVGSETHRSRRI